MTIEFWWRQIFEILIFHKPSLGSLNVPQKIWARSVQPFLRLLDTNRQTDKPNLYIDLMTIEFWLRQIFEIFIFHKPSLGSLNVPQKIGARSVQPFWRLLDTNRQTDKPNLYIDNIHEMRICPIIKKFVINEFGCCCTVHTQKLSKF